ncbi:MAG: enoyl-CoA hydratase [Betaproteobacteria bacterium]|nr:enoyl-CoA hydratase [Betaproteobacteria bacterium]
MSGQLLTERHGERSEVMLITLHNPQARNTLSPSMYVAGVELLATAERDDSVAAVVITGSDGMFCAGGNLQRLADNRQRPAEVQAQSIEQLHGWVEAIRLCPKPVVAAVEGAAAGAGLSLALACDLLVAAEDAKFVMAYINVGLSPDGGGSWQLVRNLPRALAAEAAMLGRPLSAALLHQHGVVNRIAEPGRALATAMELAEQLAAKSPDALASIKELLNAGQEQTLNQHLQSERDLFVRNLFGPGAAEGIAAFLERRTPRFRR